VPLPKDAEVLGPLEARKLPRRRAAFMETKHVKKWPAAVTALLFTDTVVTQKALCFYRKRERALLGILSLLNEATDVRSLLMLDSLRRYD